MSSRRLSKQLSTEFLLPPGILPGAKVEQVLQLCLKSYGWIKPMRYSVAWGWEPIAPGRPFLKGLMKGYTEDGSVLINGRTEREGLGIYCSPVYGGNIGCWWPTDKLARRPESREAHVQQVVQLMRLVDSPLAYAAIYDDRNRKRQWEVDGRVEFVGDYNEGLLGLFWRTFLGPPFVRLFGERLATLPPGTARDLGGGIWLIEPYPMPADALTEEGQARERELIERLGRECFFDHQRHLKASRRPELPYLDEEAAWTEYNRAKYEKKYGKGSPQVETTLKCDEIVRWAHRHVQELTYPVVEEIEQWLRPRYQDPDILRWTPEQVAQEVRARCERESSAPPASAPGPELDRVRDALGGQASQALQNAGDLAKALESQAGEVLGQVDPEMRIKVQGLAMLADLLFPKGPAPETKAPAGPPAPKRKKRKSRGS